MSDPSSAEFQELTARYAQLEHRFALLQAGLDQLDQGISVFDGELKMVAWNDPFLQLLDFPQEMAYVGAPFDSFIRYNAERGEYGAGDVEQLVAERVKAALTFQPHYLERKRPNGQIITVRGEPMPGQGFVSLYTDVTMHRRFDRMFKEQNAELERRVWARTVELQATNSRLVEAGIVNSQITAALRRSEERMKLITDTVPALIGYFDREQIYRYANKGYSDWFGRSKDQIVGHTVEDVVGVKVYAHIRQHIEQAIEGHSVSYEYAMQKGSGSGERVVAARSTLVPEIGPEGEVLGCFVLSLDITELKRTQAALVQAQKMEAVGQLTGGLSHDFNNILTVVIGNLAALRERRGTETEIAEFLEPALQASHRGAEVIRRLLTFSRQQPLEPRPVEVGELIVNSIKFLRRSLPESITLSSCSHDEPLLVMADPHQLESALLNLALNARDAMPEGGQLCFESATRIVTEEDCGEFQATPGSYVQISVSDNGTGMSAETLERAFEPFFTTKHFGSGSGLGLSMVYGFVKQSGGGIRILSQLGRGSKVSLLLPRVTEAVQLERPLAEARPSDSPIKPLVLLVEDDPDVRKVVRLQLMELGYPVLETDNGADAAQMLEHVPDIGILISDMVMPGGMDGRQLARLARQHYPDIQVVLISGYVHGGEVQGGPGQPPEGLEAPLLSKPFGKQQLATVLEGGAR